MLKVGDIIAAKNITHREVVEMREDKNGRQKPRVNQFGFKFQTEANLLSTTGVFIFLGTYPEMNGPDKRQEFAEQQLRRLGWSNETSQSVDAVARGLGDSTSGPRA